MLSMSHIYTETTHFELYGLLCKILDKGEKYRGLSQNDTAEEVDTKNEDLHVIATPQQRKQEMLNL